MTENKDIPSGGGNANRDAAVWQETKRECGRVVRCGRESRYVGWVKEGIMGDVRRATKAGDFGAQRK